MLFLLLRILFTIAFSHLLRLSQARTPHPIGAAAVNYAVAALACSAWTAWARCGWHPHTALLGGLAGFTYVTSLVMILPAMKRSGVSLVGAVTQLSLMAPVGVSIWRFHEYPNAFQSGGIALCLVALPILSATSSVQVDERRAGFDPLILLLFASTSASQVLMKEFAATRPPGDLPLYSGALFVAATVFTLLWLLWQGGGGEPSPPPCRGWTSSEWAIGTLLGTANVLQLVFLLLALRTLPAVVVFPLSAVLGLTANVVASMLFWKERPPPAGWLGIALAAVAVVLLSVKR
jgi:drug/metabolite transporter (DMT)-like permease